MYLNNWDKYINQVLASYHVTPHLRTAETPCFLVYGRDPNLPLNQLLELMQQFLGDSNPGCLDLKAHHFALAIAKKTLMKIDSNMPKRQQTTPHPISKLVKQYSLKTSSLANGI